MSKVNLPELFALAKKATPGPWKLRLEGSPDDCVIRTIEGQPCEGGKEVAIVTTGSYSDFVEACNAGLIYTSVNALPAIETAFEELKELEDEQHDSLVGKRLRAILAKVGVTP